MNAPVHPATFATLTTRQLLEAQRDQLAAAIAVGTDPFDLTHANRYLRRVDARLQANDTFLDQHRGAYGQNGWAPGIDDVCRRLWWGARIDGATSLKDDFADFHAKLDAAEAWLASGNARFTTPVATPLGTLFEDAGL